MNPNYSNCTAGLLLTGMQKLHISREQFRLPIPFYKALTSRRAIHDIQEGSSRWKGEVDVKQQIEFGNKYHCIIMGCHSVNLMSNQNYLRNWIDASYYHRYMVSERNYVLYMYVASWSNLYQICSLTAEISSEPSVTSRCLQRQQRQVCICDGCVSPPPHWGAPIRRTQDLII